MRPILPGAADDRVVGEFLDFVFHAFPSQSPLDLRLRKPLYQGAGDEYDPGAAQENHRDRPAPQPRIRDRHHFLKTDAEHSDDHHVKGVPPGPAGGAVAHREDRDHHSHGGGGEQQILLRAIGRLGHPNNA